jgi:energy-coupling factor transporter ATP-binding protein EcfA2
MPRFFNTAGPCVPAEHYLIPPERRLPEARSLIDRGLFFVLHAPRQSGKTTLLNTLARALNQEGCFTALVISVEHLQRVTDVQRGNLAILHDYLGAWARARLQGQAPHGRRLDGHGVPVQYQERLSHPAQLHPG